MCVWLRSATVPFRIFGLLVELLNLKLLKLYFPFQEAFITTALAQLNVTEGVSEWLSGPGYLPWQWSGDVHTLLGPLGATWPTNRQQLLTWVVTYCRSLGMKVVLPAFSGHVPSSFASVHPGALVTQLPAWGPFNTSHSATAFLQPTDPLFATLTQAYMEALVHAVGTDHMYLASLFAGV